MKNKAFDLIWLHLKGLTGISEVHNARKSMEEARSKDGTLEQAAKTTCALIETRRPL
jgi:hypothetical protein